MRRKKADRAPPMGAGVTRGRARSCDLLGRVCCIPGVARPDSSATRLGGVVHLVLTAKQLPPLGSIPSMVSPTRLYPLEVVLRGGCGGHCWRVLGGQRPSPEPVIKSDMGAGESTPSWPSYEESHQDLGSWGVSLKESSGGDKALESNNQGGSKCRPSVPVHATGL